MEVTNASLSGHHHEQVVALMKKKFQDLLDFAKTKNRKVLHLDWIAGNPNDPIKLASPSATAHDGMTAEERELSDKVARAVMSVTHGVDEWDESMTWNKAMFFGDWLTNEKGVRQHYLEIQIKRISGADDGLMRANGINPDYIWLPMHDATIPSIAPIVVPPVARSGMPSQFATRQLPPTPADIAARTAVLQGPVAAQDAPSLETPTSSADKGKDKAAAPPEPQTGVTNPAAPVIVSSDSVRPIGITLSPQAPSSLSLAGSSQTAIPRSEPMRSTGSINSEESSEGTISASESSGEDKVHLEDGTSSFQSAVESRPVGPFKTLTKDDIIRHRKIFEEKAATKHAEMKAIFSFLQDPQFIERKKKSFVYAVRVIAIPDPGNIVNVFNGPRLEDRKGTLLAAGGWIVPPLEERVHWRDTHKRFYKHKGAKPNRYEGLPKPMIQNALPLQFDWTGRIAPRYYGSVPPIWNEPVDPTLEDVYWMVYQLLSGKQYLGFQQGTGFGIYRGEPAGNPMMLSQCPFKSPSNESRYHAACYPRVKEPGTEDSRRSSQ
ncbi:hypothetical protein VTJ49DRAFT_6457 [Mycothermus thermophilus]|uniref:Uncharacterized protein n=1 Tax=Humicola insolens TaxID=85995 RepID=A0ABR3V2D4_HUMIN